MTEEALRYIKRILELLAAAGITDTDALKHTLEDAARWRADLFEGRLVDAGDVVQLRALLNARDQIDADDLKHAKHRVAALEAAMAAFLAKWELVLPAIQSAEGLAFAHGARYAGPTLEAEIAAFRVLLANPRPEGA